MKYTFLNRTKRELNIWHLPEQFLAFAVSVVVLTILGPFDTYYLALLPRFLYWLLCIMSGWCVMIFSLTLILRHPGLDEWPGWSRLALAIVISVVPTFYLVQGVDDLVRPEHTINSQWKLLFDIAFLCSFIGIPLFLRVQTRLGQTGSNIVDIPAPFLERLEPSLGVELISLSMQDHYVEVTTTKGSKLLFMRFSDALDELADYKGFQIHRSHWVSANAFIRRKRENGRLVAELSDGRVLPISRTYSKAGKQLQSTTYS